MADIKNIVEEIKKLTIVEVSELVKALEEEFGVSAAAPVAVAAAPVAGAAAAPADGTGCAIASDGLITPAASETSGAPPDNTWLFSHPAPQSRRTGRACSPG